MPFNRIDDQGRYIPAPYVLDVSCVSGDEVQVVIHNREDIVEWVRQLNHEGAVWQAIEFLYEGGNYDHITGTKDISDDILADLTK